MTSRMPSVSATSPVEQMAPVASAATRVSALGRMLKALTYPSRFGANAHWVRLFCWRRRRLLPLGDSVTPPRAVRLTSNPVRLWGPITHSGDLGDRGLGAAGAAISSPHSGSGPL